VLFPDKSTPAKIGERWYCGELTLEKEKFGFIRQLKPSLMLKTGKETGEIVVEIIYGKNVDLITSPRGIPVELKHETVFGDFERQYIKNIQRNQPVKDVVFRQWEETIKDFRDEIAGLERSQQVIRFNGVVKIQENYVGGGNDSVAGLVMLARALEVPESLTGLLLTKHEALENVAKCLGIKNFPVGGRAEENDVYGTLQQHNIEREFLHTYDKVILLGYGPDNERVKEVFYRLNLD
jgi:hypothetical protein